MFIKTQKYKIALKNLALDYFNKVENNGNYDSYSNGEYKFIKNLLQNLKNKKEEGIIFDIGANIGDYSQQICALSKELNVGLKMHLFEPQKKCFEILSSNFTEDYISLNNFGLSNKKGEMNIFYDEEKSGLASLYKRDIEHYNIKLDKFERIMLERADEYIARKELKFIDFVKIDVEGHELEVLRSFGEYLRGDFIDFIQFEYGGTNLDAGTKLLDFYRLLESKGFIIGKIMPQGLELRSYHSRMENFNYSNYVAISKKVLKS